MLDARNVGEIFNVKSLYEFGAGSQSLLLAASASMRLEEEKKATIEGNRPLTISSPRFNPHR